MKVNIDKDACIGSGNCEALCPNIFKVVDGKSLVQVDPISSDEDDCLEKALGECPAGAISIS